ncbi:DUF881 domain-containing protein [Bacilliculturomica massiliensis]|uniref:DUF881 domain-containing protein n=1 Tax=Bacilliculturomica massiliensis TaxID=1917867 RepID=UPI00102F8945|nr:DUF881 domain-containing protein [Bacilliculturomica massiliensis]
MKSLKKGTAAVLLVALAAGIMLSTQMGMPTGEKLYVSAKALDDMKVLIDSEKESIRRTELQIEDAKKQIDDFEALSADDNTEELIASGKAELNYYRMASGRVPVKGDGVKIVIADSERDLFEGENVNDLLVHDIDVLMILNDLLTAGAEAVSINGHRVVDMSAITCSGYTIRINGIFTANPFVIRAIGDPGRLYGAMMAPGSNGLILKEFVRFECTVEEDIEIPAYTGPLSYKYMTITKEGETN